MQILRRLGTSKSASIASIEYNHSYMLRMRAWPAGLRQQDPQDGPLRRRLAMARRKTVREAEGPPQRADKSADREAEGAGPGGQRGVGVHRVEGGPLLGGGAQGLEGGRGEACR